MGGFALAWAGALVLPHRSTATVSARIVADRHTGLAIGGFDPVAYFVEQAPLPGHAHLEYSHAGATWRFRNEGNRAAFMARPDVYTPRFGGYDPVNVARGVATPGHPTIWIVSGKRLWLFHNNAARDAFNAGSEIVIAAAERKWPEILRTLVQ